MITKAYIHEYGNCKIEPEHKDVKDVLESRGIECELFTSKRLQRNQLQLDMETLVIGDHTTILQVFKKLDINTFTSSYPESLKKYLKRNIWETTVRKLLKENSGESPNIFVKPKSKTKLFTGFVIQSNYDLFKLDALAKDTELSCSSVIEWLSEFRVFVNQSKIVGIKNYNGNENLVLDMKVVETAIQDFENSKERTDGYGIDFGILKNGETALVEWNDGFALGSYGLDKEIYTDLIVNRWKEILRKSNLNL
ncbi:ATP-grasp domain-containing protein [Chryseobacterium ginsengisoli]|uniref:ATP-grasp domain-containing protein n=1 Tax=Chryseobacterium ginsengisoli TaxID=363853 RepID=A0ABP9LUY2_9FLAO